MAKRWSEGAIWDKSSFRRLEPKYKLLFNYLCDKCNIAGIIDIDLDLWSFQIGYDYSLKDLENLKEHFVLLNNEKLFSESYILFQQNIMTLKDLNSKNKCHLSILKLLEKYNLIENQAPSKPLTSPLEGPREAPSKGPCNSNSNSNVIVIAEKNTPTFEEVLDYCYLQKKLYDFDAVEFFDKQEANNWVWKDKPVKNWKTTLLNWSKNAFSKKPSKANISRVLDWTHTLPRVEVKSLEIELLRRAK